MNSEAELRLSSLLYQRTPGNLVDVAILDDSLYNVFNGPLNLVMA